MGVWAVIYFVIKGREARKEMLVVSLWTSLLGFTEPLFVPEYWNPPSLFDLAHRTGFDIESIIFSFAMGGIAVIIYESIFKYKHSMITGPEKHSHRHRFHFATLSSAPLTFFTLLLATNFNPIYSSFIALIVGGLATWYCRPDLKNKMIVSAFLFLGLYLVYFLTLIAAYPGYVGQVWNFSGISGFRFAGVPIEELMFAFGLGFLWSSVYEHFLWKKLQ